MANDITDIAPAAIAEPIASDTVAQAEVVAPAVETAIATPDMTPVATPVTTLAEPKRKAGRPRKAEATAAEVIKVSPVKAGKPAGRKLVKATKTAAAKVPAKITAVVIKPRSSAIVLPRTVAPKTKDIFIMTAKTTEMTATIQTAMQDAAAKAKTALEKGQTAIGEMGTFTKGNMEAVVESGKILATGLQEMGKTYATDTKSVVETMTAEIKDLASVKSPAEFFEKQSAMLRKQFDAAVAASSKNSEAMLKLASEAFQPISNRVSLAVEKMKQAA